VRRGLLRWPSGELTRARASGEENVVGIAALGKALTLLERIGMPVVEAEEQALTGKLVAGLSALPGVEIFGLKDPTDPRFQARTGVVAFSVRHVPHNLVGQELAEQAGIGVRCGCFCAHLLVKALLHIHPLRARAADLGLLVAPSFSAGLLPGLVRVSLGLENRPNDIARCLSTLKRIVEARRPWLTRSLASTRNGTPFLPHTATGTRVQSFAMAAVERVYGSTAEEHSPNKRPIPRGRQAHFARDAALDIAHPWPCFRGQRRCSRMGPPYKIHTRRVHRRLGHTPDLRGS
jgi:hypothetical protein